MKRVVIVGGTSAVSSRAQSALKSAGYSVERRSGATRYETSATIASKVTADGMSWSTVVVASGENFPDALSGAGLVGSKKGVLLLTASDDSSAVTKTLKPKKPIVGTCYILGGQAAVSWNVENALNDLLK